MRAVAIVQARMGSTRLPGKVLRPLAGGPVLWHVVERARQAPGLAEVVVATSSEPGDEAVQAFCRERDISVFAGSETDVLDRYYRAATAFGADPVVRITADCPLVDPDVIDRVLGLYRTGRYDYVASAAGAPARLCDGGRYPDGLSVEVCSYAALARAWREADERSDREHVTPYLSRVPGRFRVGIVRSAADLSHLRLTVDYEEDLELVSRLYEALYSDERPFFGLAEVVAHLEAHPELADVNREHAAAGAPTRLREAV